MLCLDVPFCKKNGATLVIVMEPARPSTTTDVREIKVKYGYSFVLPCDQCFADLFHSHTRLFFMGEQICQLYQRVHTSNCV